MNQFSSCGFQQENQQNQCENQWDRCRIRVKQQQICTEFKPDNLQ